MCCRKAEEFLRLSQVRCPGLMAQTTATGSAVMCLELAARAAKRPLDKVRAGGAAGLCSASPGCGRGAPAGCAATGALPEVPGAGQRRGHTVSSSPCADKHNACGDAGVPIQPAFSSHACKHPSAGPAQWR